ncbi:holin family protein [Paracoccus sp. SCSIO 75233]|uniref:holin family protein n=1 Tax=Paracoccus sp. SCSIO 75233 TaxID=3017782 RepID=UPI0022EFE060|nr:holin family protein [Paracoccus sp. SCSIO 75233]WBU52012.1 holin family protein [Paracoccus sp. SCSIO 75233]
MGMIDRFLGLGTTAERISDAATGVAEMFRENATRRMELDEAAYRRAIGQFGAEFAAPATGWFDRLVDGLNRLPRPFLTLGTLGLFVYAMADPVGFRTRMAGLQEVPEPLWWLLGAIVSFYFGAREAYYFRKWPSSDKKFQARFAQPQGAGTVFQGIHPGSAQDGTKSFPDNAALAEWAVAR